MQNTIFIYIFLEKICEYFIISEISYIKYFLSLFWSKHPSKYKFSFTLSLKIPQQTATGYLTLYCQMGPYGHISNFFIHDY